MAEIHGNSKRKAKNLQYIRIANRAEVIRFLSIHNDTTRMTLANHLGLSKMAISNIINEMLAKNLVIEYASEGTIQDFLKSGRKSMCIKLAVEKYVAIGIYISRDEIQGIVADITGHVHKIWRIPFNWIDDGLCLSNREEFIQNLFSLIDSIMSDTTFGHQRSSFLGIGVCSIGPLDLKNGILLAPPNFHGIEQVELLSLLHKRYRLPVLLDNDMNAAAQGEHLYGAGQDCQHVVYLGLTNGIGAGLISYGRIFQGSEGFGGELGHMSIQMDGPLCLCGQRGCFELYTSVPILLHKTGSPDLETLIRRSQCDEIFRNSWLPSFMQAMVVGLVNIANIFDPDIILIGHEGAALAELIISELEEKTNQLAFQHRSKKVPVRLAEFGEKAPLIGGASLVFQAVFRGELSVEEPDASFS